MLLVGQSGKAAADDGMFPRVFARLNAQRRTGARACHRRRADDDRAVRDHVADLGRPVQQDGGSRRHADHRAVCVRRGVGRESDRRPQAAGLDVHAPTNGWRSAPSCTACGPSSAAIRTTVVHAMVALLISVPLYPFFIRSMEEAAKRKAAAPSGAARSRRGYHAMNMYTCLTRSPAMQPITTLVDPSGGRRRTLVAAAVLALLALPAFGQEAGGGAGAAGVAGGARLDVQSSTPRRARSASPILSTRTRSPSNRRAISATTGSKGRSSRR